MTTLFIHAGIYAPVYPGYRDFVEELDEHKVIILPASMASQQPEVRQIFDEVIEIGDRAWDLWASPEVDVAAFTLHARRPIQRIVSTGELGVLRAARLREALGVDGQSVRSALEYRDKCLMKLACEGNGIRVPRFAPIHGVGDLLKFAQDIGFPFVVKPRFGSGSIGVTLVRTEEGLRDLLRELDTRGGEITLNLLAEEYVNGQLYSVNGYATADGRIRLSWPARYLERGNLDTLLSESTYAGIYLLDEDDRLTSRLRAFTERCLRALAWPAHGFAFHAEMFLDEETSELIFCEAACRPGGGPVVEVYERAFGVNLTTCAMSLQAGLPVARHRTTPVLSVGGLMAPVPRGVLRLSTPDAPPFPWLLRYERRFEAGHRSAGRLSCIDCSAIFFVGGRTSSEVRERFERLITWNDRVATWADGQEPIDEVDLNALEFRCQKSFVRAGLDPETATDLVQELSTNEVHGYAGHGFIRVPEYLGQLKAGHLSADLQPAVEVLGPSSALIDGKRALGLRCRRTVAFTLNQMLEQQGIVCVGLKHAGHLGRLKSIAEDVTNAGHAVLGFVNYSGAGSVVAPWPRGQGKLCTNPVLIGVPLGEDRLILDCSTSVASEGRVRARLQAGLDVPAGWLVDERGRSVSDPSLLYESPRRAFLQPLGGSEQGFKGFALGLLAEVMSGLLTGGGFLGQPDSIAGNSGLFIGISMSLFRDAKTVRKDLRTLIGALGEDIEIPGAKSRRSVVRPASIKLPASLLAKL